jgi:hypothetical protein
MYTAFIGSVKLLAMMECAALSCYQIAQSRKTVLAYLAERAPGSTVVPSLRFTSRPGRKPNMIVVAEAEDLRG